MAHPIRLVVTDDLRRSRLTVFFRLPLAIPQLIWLALWGSVVYGEFKYARTQGAVSTASTLGTLGLAAVVTLFSGWLWPELHALHVRFLRWSTHSMAYLALIADPWPRLDARDEYPIDVQVDPPARQDRWKSFFRVLLAIPAILFAIVLVVVLMLVAFIGWFVCLVIGRMPAGMRDLGAYCLRFYAQTTAYLLYLTDRYPSLSTDGPVAPEAAATDQLRKLADLRDAGILTAEEFEAKRRLVLE